MTTRRRRRSRGATLALALAGSPAALLVWACLKPTQFVAGREGISVFRGVQ